MIKFNKEPKLNDKEKEYVIEYLKPLLKQNKMIEARERLLNDIDNLITDDENIDIASFLLSHLQDNYFKGSDNILDSEFAYLGIVHIDIPSWVTSIDSHAFQWCEKLESISIPDGVTRIEEYTFGWCDSLKNIVIPQTVVNIGENAFQGCDSLTDVYIPDKVEWLESSAFEDCSNLRKVSMPSSCELGYGVFNGDDKVEIVRR